MIAKVAKVNAYHVTLFADYLAKLAATPEGEGSLLDNVAVVYGSSMGDADKHEPRNLPILVAGGCGGSLKGGRHLRYTNETPLMNLYVSLLNKICVPIDQFGDSSGIMPELTGI